MPLQDRILPIRPLSSLNSLGSLALSDNTQIQEDDEVERQADDERRSLLSTVGIRPENILTFLRSSMKPSISHQEAVWSCISILYFVICMYLVSVANSHSDDLNPNASVPMDQRKVLKDIPLEYTQSLHIDLPHVVPEILVATSVISWILRVVFMPSAAMALALLRRSFWITGTIYLMRAICVDSTILPFSYTICQVTKDPETSAWIDGFNILLMHRSSCGDVVFSGHSIVYCIAFLSCSTYNLAQNRRWRFILSVLVYAQFLLGLASLLATSYHYSIDIMTAVFVCGMVWMMYHTALRIYDSQLNMSKWAGSLSSGNSRESLRHAEDQSEDLVLDIPMDDDIWTRQNPQKHSLKELKRVHGGWVEFICLIDGQLS
eukprot:Partr_v1_DN25581_c0_g1_i1_m20831